jgi:hypothetical protein
MKTTTNFPVAHTNYCFHPEAARRRASQARAEFLAALFADLYRSVRDAVARGAGRVPDNA